MVASEGRQTLTNQGKEGELHMSTKYDDRDRDRQRNHGRRSGQEYDRSYDQSRQSGWGSAFDDEDQRYAGESRWRGQQYGTGRAMYGSGGDYESRNWGSEGEDDRYLNERNRNYGSSGRGGYSGGGSRDYGREYGRDRTSRGYEGRERSGETYGSTRYGDEYGSNYGGGFERGEGRYRDTTDDYSQRSSYPSGYRSGESYGQSGRSYGDSERGEGRRYGQDRDRYEGRGGWESRNRYEGRDRYECDDRGWWERLQCNVASWFVDEDDESRRQMERPHRGRGPKGYRPSDDRIKEDVNDRLSEGYLDATEVDVSVSNGEVVLSGTVDGRADKLRAEAIAENVSGVLNVENRLRVRNRQQLGGTYGMSEGTTPMGTGTTGTTGTTGATGTTGTTGATGTSGTSATGTGATESTGTSTNTARGKTAGS